MKEPEAQPFWDSLDAVLRSLKLVVFTCMFLFCSLFNKISIYIDIGVWPRHAQDKTYHRTFGERLWSVGCESQGLGS